MSRNRQYAVVSLFPSQFATSYKLLDYSGEHSQLNHESTASLCQTRITREATWTYFNDILTLQCNSGVKES